MGVVIESLGWFGAVTILVGYLLFSAGRLPNGVVYQTVNLVGALAITVNVAAHHALPSTLVNGIWAVIAAVVLVRMWAARRRAGLAADGAHVTGRAAGETGHASTEAAVELPATTLVLPVIGPALRGSATQPVEAEPTLHSGRGPSGAMSDSVPVVTAAIAVALATAARDGAERRLAANLAAQLGARPDAQLARGTQPADRTQPAARTPV
ncbi:CBU_0592 family membrane protein [Curtobacterium sp. RRHDQ10]|uniref:CBU_0592 family membrane protein n=1 Tax=Curtobacterium phyllosphaerae TaxID=3413379 RepID=UPI003BEFD50C